MKISTALSPRQFTSRPRLTRASGPIVRRLVLGGLAMGGLATVGCAGDPTVPFEPKRILVEETDAAQGRFSARPEPVTDLPRDSEGSLDVIRATREQSESSDTTFPQGELYPISAEQDGEAATQPTTQAATDPTTLPADGTLGDVDFVTSANGANQQPMTLREVVAKTVMYGFDVSVAAYQPAIEETRITEAEGRFDTVFRQSLEYQFTSNEIAGIGTGFGVVTDDEQQSVQMQTTFEKLLRSGGQASLNLSVVRVDNANAVLLNQAQFNPTWETSLNLRFTQPLLRDFGTEVNNARIVINQNNQRISVLDFREALEEAMVNAETLYWNVWAAQQAVEIQREQLDETLKTLDRINIRREQAGDADIGQQSQALGEVFVRRQQLIQAESTLRQLTVDLKRVMNDPDLPIAGGDVVVPVTEPSLEPLAVDMDAALDAALMYRTEIGQQLLRVQSARTALQVARSNLKPRLDLVLSGGLQGLDDSFGDAITNQFTFDGPNVAAGMQFEVPLGNVEARAVLRRALLQEQQGVEQYGQVVNLITSDVIRAVIDLRARYDIVKEARYARMTAEKQVEVNLVKQDNQGMDPFFIDFQLRTLGTLANARSAEAQAIADYNVSLLQYQRVKGTLMRYNNVIMKESVEAVLVNPALRSMIKDQTGEE